MGITATVPILPGAAVNQKIPTARPPTAHNALATVIRLGVDELSRAVNVSIALNSRQNGQPGEVSVTQRHR
jgi:hypothetical protein